MIMHVACVYAYFTLHMYIMYVSMNIIYTVLYICIVFISVSSHMGWHIRIQDTQ